MPKLSGAKVYIFGETVWAAKEQEGAIFFLIDFDGF
jgi:hypothetical protein